MTAGRKSLVAKQTEQDEPIVLEQEFSSAMDNMRREGQSLTLAESQRQATVRVVALRVGYQLPGDCADPGLIQRDVASNMRRTAEAMLQVGLGLICLKEACQHGEFLARLEVLRFEPRAAQKYMQVASRLSNAPSTARLLKVVESQTKLLELIVLDDEQLEELELTGQTGELKLDDVATMSVKELRAKVRELKGDVAAKEEVLSRRAKQVGGLPLPLLQCLRQAVVFARGQQLRLRSVASGDQGSGEQQDSLQIHCERRHHSVWAVEARASG